MKVADALRGVTRLFLDTAPVIYHVEQNAKYSAVTDECFGRIDVGTLLAVTSPITLSESLVAPYRLGRKDLQKDFTDLIVAGRGVTFVVLEETIACRAAELRARYNLSLPDALQVSAALGAGCDALLTNDAGLKRVVEIRVLVLDELEV